MKKVDLLLDADGILFNFVSSFSDFIHQRTGQEVAHNHVTKWDFFAALPHLAHLREDFHDHVAGAGFCSDIRPYSEALHYFPKLLEYADVTIVTSPWHGSLFWMGERERSLKRWFGIEPKSIIHAEEKHRITGDLLVDDKPGHVINWSRKQMKQAFLFDRPWNRDLSGYGRVKDWEHLVIVVAGMHREKNKKLGAQ